MDRDKDPKFDAIVAKITDAFVEFLQVAGSIKPGDLASLEAQNIIRGGIRRALMPMFDSLDTAIIRNVDQALEIAAYALSRFPQIKGVDAADLIRTLKIDKAYYKAEAEAEARFERRELGDSNLN